VQALANNEELACKAAVHAVMMMKQGPSTSRSVASLLCLLRTLSTAPCRRARTLRHRAGTLLRWIPTCLRSCSYTGRPRPGRRLAFPVWRLPPHIGVGRAWHRPQPNTIDRVRHPGRLKEALSHLYCRHAKVNQPVRRYARARWGTHKQGNGSSHLSIVIDG
jgi:hypothetical protein